MFGQAEISTAGFGNPELVKWPKRPRDYSRRNRRFGKDPCLLCKDTFNNKCRDGEVMPRHHNLSKAGAAVVAGKVGAVCEGSFHPHAEWHQPPPAKLKR